METVGNYRLGRVLGTGGFSEVRLGTHVTSGERCAVKCLERNAQNTDERIKDEIRAFRRLQHPNIVGYNSHVVTRRRVFISLEYVGGGELYDLLAESVRFTEERARELFAQVLSGVEYCHSRGVCHRDLKLENLLLTADGKVKITDFGFSKNFTRGSPRTCQGTALYVAPEVVMNAGRSEYDGKAADVWSLGIILYLLVAGRFPFNRGNKAGIGPMMPQAEKDMFRRTNFRVPCYLSASVVTLLRGILTLEPARRMTTEQIRAHAWMAPAAVDGDSTAGTADSGGVNGGGATSTPPRAPRTGDAGSADRTPPTQPPSEPRQRPASPVDWDEVMAEGEEEEEDVRPLFDHPFDDEDDVDDEVWDVALGFERTFERRPSEEFSEEFSHFG